MERINFYKRIYIYIYNVRMLVEMSDGVNDI